MRYGGAESQMREIVPSLLPRATAAMLLLVALVQLLAATDPLVESFAQRAHAPRSCSCSCSCSSGGPNTLLHAESPNYQAREGILKRSECVGKGNYLLTIDSTDHDAEEGDNSNSSNNRCCDYEPGHVLALEIRPPSPQNEESSGDTSAATATGTDDDNELASRLTIMTEKTQRDALANDGWMRGPYTVSRGYGSSNSDDANKNDGFQVLIREVGFKSRVLATSPEGTPVRFGGKFKVPIVEGILVAAAADANAHSSDNNNNNHREATQRVVLVATGVGVGPCVGAAELLLAEGSGRDNRGQSIRAIDLLASFRTAEEIAMESDLDALQQQQQQQQQAGEKINSNSNSNHPIVFRWKPVVTENEGRMSASGPEVLADRYLRSSDAELSSSISATRGTHYHVIGNGQLVHEWTEGLKRAGVPKERVTTETYFNHASKADPSAADAICGAVRLLEAETDNEVVDTSAETTNVVA